MKEIVFSVVIPTIALRLCWAFSRKLSLAYNALGMIEAFNICKKQANSKNM
jgi:hypothetical protein